MKKLLRIETLIWAVLGAEALYAAAVYILRARAGFDYFMWPDSPFMTDMLKIRAGNWIYSDPADANSFVYTPGLAYLNFSLLSPFGLALCMTAQRLLNCAYGIAAAGFGAAAALELAGGVASRPDARKFLCFSFLLLFLILSVNPLFDVPHPDNLNSLMLAANFLLTLRGVTRKNLPSLVGASCLATLGVLVKQTSGLLCLADAAALWLLAREGKAGRLWPLFPVALCAAALSAFLMTPYAKFYTLDLLSQQGLDDFANKTLALAEIFLSAPMLATYAVFTLWFRKHVDAKRHSLWAAAAAFPVLAFVPALAAFYKIMGTYNNFVIVLFALFILFLPALYEAAAGKQLASWRQGAVLLAALMCWPLKAPPPPAMTQYAAGVQQAVTQAAQEHKTVLLANGTLALVNAGLLDVPKDRALSILELSAGQAKGIAAARTIERIAHRDYDVIVLNSVWYTPEITNAIARNYKETSVIPGGFMPPPAAGASRVVLYAFIPWLRLNYNNGLHRIAAPGAHIYEKIIPRSGKGKGT